MPNYVGFAVGGGDDPVWADAEQAERVLERFLAWEERLRELGRHRGGSGLADDGKVLQRGGDGVLVSDGPFAESSEVVGGYVEVEAADMAEAIELFRDHPHLELGRIEVREVTI